MWDPDCQEYSWATAGYSGAINSGKTTCGLLIGCSIAIGLRHGKDFNCIPLEEPSVREKAIAEVKGLYGDFIDHFKFSDCQTLIQCDFSKPGEKERFQDEKLYVNACYLFFNHIMARFVEADKIAEA
ncbi:MAG: C_GCAxxG_C_C family protein [SAR324 cluster bacterium]|nr:C_GCAxxG_C_C family protein [SAR324 cluster bacterium]